MMNLTIIDKIELGRLTASTGKNFYTKSQFSSRSKPIFVKKGYVPIMKRSISNSPLFLSNLNDINRVADFFCVNANMSLNETSQLSNLTEINFSYSKNVAISFIFSYQNNQLDLSNYTINHVYSLFGSFVFHVYTSLGGNILSPSRNYINVQRIETYPFRSIEVNQFDLNCSLNGLRLDCILRLNLSNYANSYQVITIDYGDGISFDSFRINPYCKYLDISYINQFTINVTIRYPQFNNIR